MPIAIEDYATPKWLKMRERYPFDEDKNYRYRNLTINPRTPIERYNGDRDTGWKAPGYNPNHNSITIERVNTGVDTSATSFKPY